MKTIAIISDTHGNTHYIQKFSEIMTIKKPDIVMHLGDHYDDADALLNQSWEVIRVPGLWTAHYAHPYIDNRIGISIEGWNFFLSHTPKANSHDLPGDPVPEKLLSDGNIDIFLYGHTHVPVIQKRGAVLCVNPGHLKSSFDRSQAPSYAIAEVTPNEIHWQLIHFLTDTVFADHIETRIPK